MRAVILEAKDRIRIRDYTEKMELGPEDLRIDIKSVGVCGSDVHYYTHGRIGDFVVKEPMVLGHEAAGIVTEIGRGVTRFKVGDRVCMEPGIPRAGSEFVREGVYNLDPDLTFWATPPVDGCLRESVIHPQEFSYQLDDCLDFAQGALVEPLAVGLQAAKKAGISPGDTALVYGAGTIGIMIALSALAGGCSTVIVADIKQGKLDIIGSYQGIVPVNLLQSELEQIVNDLTRGKGVDVVFEATGNAQVISNVFTPLRPAGTVVLVGMPITPVPFDIVAAQCKEANIQTVFRYTNVYQKALDLLVSGKIDLTPLISKRVPFDQAIEAFDLAAENREEIVKIVIDL